MTSADFDGDGNPDLAVTNLTSSSVAVLLGDGSGGFPSKTDFTTGSFPFAVTNADFDGDGRADLAVVNRTADSVSVLVGDGAGGFAANADFATGDRPGSVATGDFDGDGDPDLAVTNSGPGTVSVLLNSTARPPVPNPDPTSTPAPAPRTTPAPAPGGGGADDGAVARLRPNLVRPGFARAVQSGGRASGSAVARVSQARGGRIVVRLRGRMVGNRGRRCGGRIKIATRAGSRAVGTTTGRMGANCRYSKQYTIAARRIPKRLRPRGRTLVLRIAVRFQGNAQLRGDLSPTKRVKVRR